MMQHKHLAIVLREAFQNPGEPGGLVVASCLLAGRAACCDQTAIEHLRRLIQLQFQRLLQADVASLGAAVMADQGGQAGRQDLPQPAGKLPVAGATELTEIAHGMQERLLHHVSGIDLPLQPPPDLQGARRVR